MFRLIWFSCAHLSSLLFKFVCGFQYFYCIFSCFCLFLHFLCFYFCYQVLKYVSFLFVSFLVCSFFCIFSFPLKNSFVLSVAMSFDFLFSSIHVTPPYHRSEYCFFYFVSMSQCSDMMLTFVSFKPNGKWVAVLTANWLLISFCGSFMNMKMKLCVCLSICQCVSSMSANSHVNEIFKLKENAYHSSL